MRQLRVLVLEAMGDDGAARVVIDGGLSSTGLRAQSLARRGGGTLRGALSGLPPCGSGREWQLRVRFRRRRAEDAQDAVAAAAALGFASLEGAGYRELDAVVRGLSRALARHELELSRRILSFHRADGWRRLAYASEAQYARERLGMSRSSMAARRALALRLERLPVVAQALGAGQIGVEAASQVVRVATPSTQAAWVTRAQQRTIKHS